MLHLTKFCLDGFCRVLRVSFFSEIHKKTLFSIGFSFYKMGLAYFETCSTVMIPCLCNSAHSTVKYSFIGVDRHWQIWTVHRFVSFWCEIHLGLFVHANINSMSVANVILNQNIYIFYSLFFRWRELCVSPIKSFRDFFPALALYVGLRYVCASIRSVF